MARVALSSHEQIEVLKTVQGELGLTLAQTARLCQVHPRTLSDWTRGKYRMRYESFQRLIGQTHLPFGRDIGQIPEFSHVRAAARLGAIRKYQLYGNPGTPEGRHRGGLRSWERRRAAADRWAPPDGFRLAKPIREPSASPALAEYLGILLGDGCLNSAFQAALYFNTQTDAEYADFMEALAIELFDVAPRRLTEPGSNGGTLLFSSKRLVDHLVQLGFQRGDKVTNQAGVPGWILNNSEYRRSCLRGLMDTDGSVYSYQHRVYGHMYTHIALCFTNRSRPLLQFVEETLASNNYHPTKTGFHVALYRRRDVDRYFSDIGTHNAKHLRKYQAYANGHAKRLGRGTQVVDGAVLEKR